MEISSLIALQKDYFSRNVTLSIEKRLQLLEQFENVFERYEKELLQAVNDDFGKPFFDTYSTEFLLIKQEFLYYKKNLKKLAKPQKVSSNLANLFSKSYLYKEPYGTCLIIGAWNYPVQLSLVPAITALAAGNTVNIKPSELPQKNSQTIAKMINDNLPKEHIHVLEGDEKVVNSLFENKLDYVFFTGSPRVGKIIYEKAAAQLCPVTLELGGKSPVIVSKTADLKWAAKKIIWGKFVNAGQTCIAPDYVFVHEDIMDSLSNELKATLEEFQYDDLRKNFTQIISAKHYQRLESLLGDSSVYYKGSGDSENRYFPPTLIHIKDLEHPLMKEEIFGPILPLLSYSNFQETLDYIKKNEKPLSAYLFSQNKDEMDLFTQNISFGGGCINDVLVHVSNKNLPFGGVGQSGIGNYHGKFGFDTFSHTKAIMKNLKIMPTPLVSPPHTEKKLDILKRFWKWV